MSTIPPIQTSPRVVPAKSDYSTVLVFLAAIFIAQLFTLGFAIVNEFRYQDQRRAAQEMLEHFQSLEPTAHDWEAEQERLEREHAEVFKAIQECFDVYD